MQNFKVRGVRAAWVHFPVGGNILDFFYFSRDSVESTESIEFKANYGKTRLASTPCSSYLKHIFVL